VRRRWAPRSCSDDDRHHPGTLIGISPESLSACPRNTYRHASQYALRREPTIYLLPECENEQAAHEYLEEVCGEISEEQLNGW
jgi:hypothetical protein